MGHHVDEQHRFGRIIPGRFHLVADGTDILVIKVFQGHEGFLAMVDKRLGQLANYPAGLFHVVAVKFQTAGGLLLVGFVQDKFSRCDDTVATLFLNARQAV